MYQPSIISITLWDFTCLRGVLRILVYGGVRMEGKIQTQKHGLPENFVPMISPTQKCG